MGIRPEAIRSSAERSMADFFQPDHDEELTLLVPESAEAVAWMVVPTTLLVVGIYHQDGDTYVVAPNGVILSWGYWETLWSSISPEFRQHMPGLRQGVSRRSGVGPMGYYGAALAAEGLARCCIFSSPDSRTNEASRAWENFSRYGLSVSSEGVDLMFGQDICESGLVLWLNPKYGLRFNPPSEEVLSALPAKLLSGQQRRAIEAACRGLSGPEPEVSRGSPDTPQRLARFPYWEEWEEETPLSPSHQYWCDRWDRGEDL